MEKDPELRYQSAADVRSDLKRLKRDSDSGRSATIDVAIPASTASPGSMAPAPVAQIPRTSRFKMPIAILVLILLMAGGYIAYQKFHTSSEKIPTKLTQ